MSALINLFIRYYKIEFNFDLFVFFFKASCKTDPCDDGEGECFGDNDNCKGDLTCGNDDNCQRNSQ